MSNIDRQIGSLQKIRRDHLERYYYALTYTKGPILDAACGVGYGSWLLATEGHEVTAVDIEPEAIAFGQEHYGHDGIQWIVGDLASVPWGEQTFKTITAFEILEHLSDPASLLRSFRKSLRHDGRLLASVPNEDVTPFDPNEFKPDRYPHLRHYTPAQFEALLNDTGWIVIRRGTQIDKQSHVQAGSGGRTLVYLCQ